MEFDLLDDDGGDDNDDNDVGGNNEDGNDNDDSDKIVGNGGHVDDDNDDENYHDDGKDLESDSEHHSEVVIDADQDLDDDEDSVTSGQQREKETQRRDGDRREVSTSTGHTARAIQPIPVVETPTAVDSSLLILDGLIHVHGMSRSEPLKLSQHICQSNTTPEGEVHQQQYKFPKGNEVGVGSQGCAASTPSQFPEDIRYCSQ